MRTFFSMLLGILVGGAVAVGVVAIAQELFPAPEIPPGQEADGADPIPLTILRTFPVAFAVGSLLGAAAAARLARQRWQPAVVTVGAFMVVAAGITMLQFPHPLWVWLAAVISPVPAAWMGGLMTHNLVVR